jgi:outer membrane protein OmpA-like peptidoglycan-associated protein
MLLFDAPKPDAKSDAPKDTGQSDPKADAAKTDAAKTDAAKTDAAKTDVKESVRETGRAPIAGRAPGQDGATGIDTVMSADPGPQGTVRFKLGFSFFSADDFPADGSSNDFSGARLALSWTPIEYLEVFGSLRSTSNVNEAGSPALLQTQGDTVLGLKGGAFVTDMIAVGGAASVHLLPGFGEGSYAGGGTSAWLRGLATFDWRKGEKLPLRLLVDLGYYFENSDALEDDPEPPIIREWGLQTARYNRITFGLALDAPVHEYISPFLEYRLDIPQLVRIEDKGEGSRDFAFGSFPHFLTPGLRGFPNPNLALEAMVRIGLADAPFTGVPQTPPWTVILGISYTLDPRPLIIEREIVKEVKPKKPPTPPRPPEGRIIGRVVDAKSGGPIPGVRILYKGGKPVAKTPQLTDGNGRFTSYRFQPGEVSVWASLDPYKPASVKAEVVAKQDTEVVLRLEVDPEKAQGRLRVRAFDNRAQTTDATVEVRTGSADGEVVESGPTSPDTPYEVELKPGRYFVTVQVDRRRVKPVTREVEVKGGERADLRVPLEVKGRSRPRTATRAPTPEKKRSGGLARRGKNTIVLARRVEFEPDTAKVTARGREVLDAVVAVMKKNPGVKSVRIDGHTHNRGTEADQKRLGNERARAVKSYMVSRGVTPGRLGTRSVGAAKPAAPNLTARDRARNERVEFVITSQE